MIDHPGPEHVQLSAGEQLVLEDIERSLAAIDPRLAERLANHRCVDDRWRRVRLPAGAVAGLGGLAVMVASAVAGDLAVGVAAVAPTALGAVAVADELADRLGGSQWPRFRRRGEPRPG